MMITSSVFVGIIHAFLLTTSITGILAAFNFPTSNNHGGVLRKSLSSIGLRTKFSVNQPSSVHNPFLPKSAHKPITINNISQQSTILYNDQQGHISTHSDGDKLSPTNTKSFYFGAGCFWGPATQIQNQNIPGIQSVTVGYCGDNSYSTKYPNAIPSYDTICSGRTKLVEAIRVEYDPTLVSYSNLLNLYCQVNNNKNGYKRQYENVVFTTNPKEFDEASQFLKNHQPTSQQSTDVASSSTVEKMSDYFYIAENYHQNYWNKWKLRLGGFVLIVGIIQYFDISMPNIVSLISNMDGNPANEVWNSDQICYLIYFGGVLFTLLERLVDVRRGKIQVEFESS